MPHACPGYGWCGGSTLTPEVSMHISQRSLVATSRCGHGLALLAHARAFGPRASPQRRGQAEAQTQTAQGELLDVDVKASALHDQDADGRDDLPLQRSNEGDWRPEGRVRSRHDDRFTGDSAVPERRPDERGDVHRCEGGEVAVPVLRFVPGPGPSTKDQAPDQPSAYRSSSAPHRTDRSAALSAPSRCRRS